MSGEAHLWERRERLRRLRPTPQRAGLLRWARQSLEGDLAALRQHAKV